MKDGYSGDRWISDTKGYTIDIGGSNRILMKCLGVTGFGIGSIHPSLVAGSWSGGEWGWGLSWSNLEWSLMTPVLCAVRPLRQWFVFWLSSQCCERLYKTLKLRINTGSLEDCNTSLGSVKGRFKIMVVQSCYTGLLYTIWSQINWAIWEHKVTRPEKAIHRMLGERAVS